MTPLVGYSYLEQNLAMNDGFQTLTRPDIDPLVPTVGPFAGLHSTYDTRWSGPWAGLDLTVHPAGRFLFSGGFERHWADFEAEADWNLRVDLAHPASFKQEADGDGLVVTLGGSYDFTDCWSLRLDLDYRKWKATDGKIRFFNGTGGEGVQKLNEVNWESRSVLVGVSYRFLQKPFAEESIFYSFSVAESGRLC